MRAERSGNSLFWGAFLLLAAGALLLRLRQLPTTDAPPESAGLTKAEVMGASRPMMAKRTKVPVFSLTESSGATIKDGDLRGKVWVASFLFTSCGDVCPAMAQKLRVLQSSLPEGALVVSITVDPARDTPEALAKYAEMFGRIPGRWLLLTGDWNEIERVANEGFSLGGDKPLFHSPNFALVDKEGYLRGYYDSRSEEKIGEMLRDASLLLQEEVGEASAKTSALEAPQGQP